MKDRTHKSRDIKTKQTGIAKKAKPADAPPLVLTNKLVITNRNPSKIAKKLCQQLREIFSPNSLTHIKDKHPRIKEYLRMADAHLISHMVVVSDKMIQIGIRPKGPTHTFKIIEYGDDYKRYHSDNFRQAPFITFEGKSALKPMFENLGKKEPGFKRTLHIKFEDDIIYIRHYCLKEKDSSDNFVMGFKEIGPRLTLQFVGTEEGLFKTARVKSTKLEE